MSEIDAIFASKGKAKAIDPTPAPTQAAPSKKKKNKKKAAQHEADEEQQPTAPAEVVVEDKPTKKRPAPETVVDPSIKIEQQKPQKRQKTSRPSPETSSKSQKDKEDEEDFKDSRGTGPRRKTEEGWSIFKEAELGIDPTAGDTPLCPFDCDCCF